MLRVFCCLDLGIFIFGVVWIGVRAMDMKGLFGAAFLPSPVRAGRRRLFWLMLRNCGRLISYIGRFRACGSES